MDIILLGFSAVALTYGLVEVVKLTGVPSRFSPLISLVVGFLIVYVGSGFGLTPETIINGIAVGLSSSGLYDIQKKTIRDE